MYFLKFAGHFCFLFSEMTLGFFLYFLKNNLFLVVLGLHCCAWALSSCGGQGLPLVECVVFSLWWFLLLQRTGL